MPFKKKLTNVDNSEEKESIDITEELCYAVAEAVLLKEDICKAICKVTRCGAARAIQLQKEVLSSPLYKQIFDDYKNIATSTVFQEDENTIMVQYNNLIRKATAEKKYEVVVRILDKIRLMQAIGDKEMEFKMTFGFEPTKTTNINLINKREKEQ